MEAASWSGDGAAGCDGRVRVGVGAGVEGAAGERTELVELVRLRMERSITRPRTDTLLFYVSVNIRGFLKGFERFF